MTSKTLTSLLAITMLSLGISACGGSSNKSKMTSTTKPAPAPTPSPTPAPSQTELATELDEHMFNQIKLGMDTVEREKLWAGYQYKNTPQYMIRVESDKPVTGFIINPQSEIDGAQKVGNNENKGLNIVRFDGQMIQAQDKLKQGNGIYDFDYEIDGKKYYLQSYQEKNTFTNNKPVSETAALSVHEVFHQFQSNHWQQPANYQQDEANYPLTAELLPLQMMTLELFKDLPDIQDKAKLKSILSQYVAIKSKEIEIDNSEKKLVRNMGLGQELYEGTARYVETLALRKNFDDKKQLKFVVTPTLPPLDTMARVRETFAFGIFYDTGASVTYLLKELGYPVEDLGKGLYPFDAAKDMLKMSNTDLEQTLAKVKSHPKWVEIEKHASHLLSGSQTSPSIQKGENFTDPRDKQIYPTVKIGQQTWMASNLNFNLINQSWHYNNDAKNGKTYGRLYQWASVKKAIPDGWHLPTDNEWKILEQNLGMSQSDLNKSGYDTIRGTNQGTQLQPGGKSLMNIQAAGFRSGQDFEGLNDRSYFWVNTTQGNEVYRRRIVKGSPSVFRFTNPADDFAISVRLIRD